MHAIPTKASNKNTHGIACETFFSSNRRERRGEDLQNYTIGKNDKQQFTRMTQFCTRTQRKISNFEKGVERKTNTGTRRHFDIFFFVIGMLYKTVTWIYPKQKKNHPKQI
jgi:hypothetical protein